MGSMRITIFLFLALGGHAQAAGVPTLPVDQARVFATCAGRFSALVSHNYLFDGAAAEAAEARRDGFADLLDATLPDALDAGLPETQAMAWRVEAKAAQAYLLSRAAFHEDARAAEAAEKAAKQALTSCEMLLLGA